MKEYRITDFGAKCCDALQTEAIQRAIDACFLGGGGRVTVPSGVFRTGGVRLRSNCELYLEAGAYLEGSRDPEDYTGYINDRVEPIHEYPNEGISRSVYPYSRWNNALIRVIDAENVSIIGEKGSMIDGRNPYDAQGEEHYRGPHGINVQNSRNLRFEGYTLRDMGNWAHAIFVSSNIVFRNVTVYGGHDGIDVRTCDDVLIEDCDLACGDDCVAGFDNNDVIVRRCHFNTACAALRFGGNHVLVEDCVADAPAAFGHRYTMTQAEKEQGLPTNEKHRHNTHNVFLYYCDHRADPRRTPGDITIRNCRFQGVDRLFSLEYDGRHKWCCNRPLSSIRFERCVAEGLAEPAYIYGDAAEKLTFELEDVHLTARKGHEDIAVIDARNYEALRLTGVTLEGFADPRIVVHDEGIVEADVRVERE